MSGTMSIGEVLAALREEFPDVSVSKIRFLESEGLVQPARSPSGYRRFAEADIERLRAILRVQRDSFMPLKIIRRRLEDADARGESPDAVLSAAAANGDADDPSGPDRTPDDFRAPALRRTFTESDLAHETGLSLAQVQQLRDLGVLCVHEVDGQTVFDHDDASVGELAKTLLTVGLDGRQLKILRRIADQEADILEQMSVAALRNPNPEAREAAIERLAAMAAATSGLRHAFVRARLRAILPR